MESKTIIRFRNGNRKGTLVEFATKLHPTICFGRESECEVAFNADKDDIVSRQHCRIETTGGDPPAFKLADLGSRNGTFCQPAENFQ